MASSRLETTRTNKQTNKLERISLELLPLHSTKATVHHLLNSQLLFNVQRHTLIALLIIKQTNTKLVV